MSNLPIAACYSVSCMDPRERIVEARFSKLLHLLDSFEKKVISGKEVTQIQQLKEKFGSTRVGLAVNFYRNARAGGGWSLDARGDLQTIKDNGLPIIAVYSTRHRQCAAVKVDRHLHDQDVAVMLVQDFDAVGVKLPPIFRAHLEVVTKHEEFDTDPMNIRGLVAYALVHGTSRNFPAGGYDPAVAARILGIDTLTDQELKKLSDEIHMSPKGLIVPSIELVDHTDGH